MGQDTLIYGIHSVKSAIHAAPERIIALWVDRQRRDQRVQAILDSARQYGIAIEKVNRETLDEKADGQVHQGVVLLTRGVVSYNESDIEGLLSGCQQPLVLVLDGVTDPHNLGACLRTAEAAGVDLVVVPRDRAAGINPTVRKAASGAAERLPFVQVTNLARTLKQLQDAGLWITGTAMEGESLYESDLTGPRVVVMGSEDKGMRLLTKEHCDQLVHIPMQGQVESLNVSVATAVVLFEVIRQRQEK